MSDAPETVTEAVVLLAADGYTSEFREHGAKLVCLACGTPHSFSRGIVERVYRFDPLPGYPRA